ncbi:MAG: ribonuclease [Betaproteobacteria bacterium]|nr:ribonuclease [Betaproteobacteria bacterium]
MSADPGTQRRGRETIAGTAHPPAQASADDGGSQQGIAVLRSIKALVLFGLLLCLPLGVQAGRHHSRNDAVPASVSVAELPSEARDTLHLIKQGGPFPFPRDGVVFGNYEQRLPQQPRGYYHEYTVKTPGVRNRGARRIVCGEPAECYYSNDHYKTFRRIRE